jgi:predicted DNA-binding transcriptional regulator AlpA
LLAQQSSGLLSLPALLQYLSVSRSCFRKIQRSGNGPRETRIGGRIFFAQSSVDEWVRSLEQAPTPAQSAEVSA